MLKALEKAFTVAMLFYTTGRHLALSHGPLQWLRLVTTELDRTGYSVGILCGRIVPYCYSVAQRVSGRL